jgi:hypothetical protein
MPLFDAWTMISVGLTCFAVGIALGMMSGRYYRAHMLSEIEREIALSVTAGSATERAVHAEKAVRGIDSLRE